MKDTVIRINHDTQRAFITIRQTRYIKRYMRLAADSDEWHLVSHKMDKAGKLSSVTYSFPAKRMHIRKALTGETLRNVQSGAAIAREARKNRIG